MVTPESQKEADRIIEKGLNTYTHPRLKAELETILSSSLDQFPSQIATQSKELFPELSEQAQQHITATLESEWEKITTQKEEVFSVYSRKKYRRLVELSKNYALTTQMNEFATASSAKKVQDFISHPYTLNSAKVLALATGVSIIGYLAFDSFRQNRMENAKEERKELQEQAYRDSVQQARESLVDVVDIYTNGTAK